MEIAPSIEEFLMAGRAGGWSPTTVAGYGWRLNRLRSWLADRRIATVADLTRRLLREWASTLTGAPATRRGMIVATRAWLAWLHAEGQPTGDLLSALIAPKIPPAVQRTITIEEVVALLDAADVPAEHGVSPATAAQICARNRAIIALLFDGLLRASELCDLTIGDIDLEDCVAHVRRGKGGKGRLAPFGGEARNLLAAHLAQCAGRRPDQPLFVALGGQRPGQPLTPRGLRIILQRLGQRAGIANVAPHAFRRGGACEAVWNGASSRIVMDAGGWTNLQMVERYTRDMELRQERTRNEYREAAPLKRLRSGC